MNLSYALSSDIKSRIVRHICFWIIISVFHGGVDFMIPSSLKESQQESLIEAIQLAIAFLPGQFVLVYGLLYFVIPEFFLKSKHFTSILLLMLLLLLAGLVNKLSYNFFYSEIFPPLSSPGVHSFGMHRTLGTGSTAACIKFMKYWYEKKYINSILQREKIHAELQALKAQVHPHFLFNTLNNIYSITQGKSSEASDMLLRLSTLLRYILYECNLSEVPLSQEFKIIKDYIQLESVRYGKNLDVNTKLPENANHHLISPLLLLPLIENCFKHGTSKVLDQPWINIQAELKENILNIKLMNSKPEFVTYGNEHTGIGLRNVKKRLELLYAGKYELKIIPAADIFVLMLRLELSEVKKQYTNNPVALESAINIQYHK